MKDLLLSSIVVVIIPCSGFSYKHHNKMTMPLSKLCYENKGSDEMSKFDRKHNV